MRSVALFSLVAWLVGCGAPATSGLGGRGGHFAPPRLLAIDEGDYYKDAAGLQGKALVSALHRIIAPHKDLGYDKGRDILFATIDDPDEDDRVPELYTGNQVGGVRDRRTAFDRGMNTEHTWPQSLGAVGAAQADLHHLRPADIKINGSRGSFAYGEVLGKEFASWPGSDGTSRLGNSRANIMVFEPRPSVRGDIARGLLYFYTCYAVDGGASGVPQPDLRNFKLETVYLARWSQADPPDAVERGRNEAIHKVQGNRNPFIDHPEWAEAVTAQ
jgi:endonuclease I